MTEPAGETPTVLSDDLLSRVRGIRAKTESATAEDLAVIGQLELGTAVATLTKRVADLETLLAETHAIVEQLVVWMTPLKGPGPGQQGLVQRPPTNDW